MVNHRSTKTSIFAQGTEESIEGAWWVFWWVLCWVGVCSQRSQVRTIQAQGQPVPSMFGEVPGLESDPAAQCGCCRARCVEVNTGHRRRPDVGRLWLSTHILLTIVLSYFFSLYPEYFLLHLHLCGDHFLRDPAQTCSEILRWLHSCVLCGIA